MHDGVCDEEGCFSPKLNALVPDADCQGGGGGGPCCVESGEFSFAARDCCSRKFDMPVFCTIDPFIDSCGNSVASGCICE